MKKQGRKRQEKRRKDGKKRRPEKEKRNRKRHKTKIITKYKQNNMISRQTGKRQPIMQTKESKRNKILWCLQFCNSVHVRFQRCAGHGVDLAL